MAFRVRRLYLCWSSWMLVPLLGKAPHTIVHNCCTNLTLRFGLPPASFDPFMIYRGVPSNATFQADPPSYSGYAPELVKMLSEEMGFKVVWVTYPWMPDDSVKDLLLSGNMMDITVMSLTGKENTSFVMTKTIINGQFGALTHVKTRPIDMFVVFAPFSTDLWVAVVCSILVLALCSILLRIIEAKSRGETLSELRPTQLLRAVYHSLAAVLGGEDYRFTSASGRTLRIAMLLFVLIMSATYTANLAAYFTQSNREVFGPSDMTELSKATACIVLEDLRRWMGSYVSKVVVAPWSPWDSSVPTEVRREWCKGELVAGRVDTVIDSYNILLKYQLQHCDDTFLVPSIKFSPFHSALIMTNSPQNFDLVTKLTAGMVQLEHRPALHQMRMETLQEGKACAKPQSSDTEAVSSESMKGMFLVCAAVGILAVLVGLVERCVAQRQSSKRAKDEEEPEVTIADGEILKQIMVDIKEIKLSMDLSQRPAAKAACSGEVVPALAGL
eukprot:TRINITY_DN91802_c0_g1_i1.p1 TRINITY_DN91802_c0_g1~~TRINITY_DN91802_c0_g1_i1.p1  ORF type:complete len:499 (-),score=31.98 TRINITY_DN91802_c0_g1_i1:66-1562(-)